MMGRYMPGRGTRPGGAAFPGGGQPAADDVPLHGAAGGGGAGVVFLWGEVVRRRAGAFRASRFHHSGGKPRGAGMGSLRLCEQ